MLHYAKWASPLKKTLHADERKRPDIVQQRKDWIDWMKEVDVERLVFIDESAAKTNMAPLRGWSVVGERCYGHAPGKWKTNTMLSSIQISGESKYFLFEGSVNKKIFKEYIEDYLIPSLSENSIIVMDNHRAHKIAFDQEVLLKHKITIKYLPPYSPDLNPIENMWSKIKEELRKAQPRDEWELWGKVDQAHKNITQKNATGWFRGCGYFH